MTIRLIALSLLASFAFSFAAQAQGEPPLPAPLEKQRASGAQIYYLGREDDMDGWVMIRAGKPETYYVSPNGAIVLGILFDRGGMMVTPRQMVTLEQTRKNDILNMVAPETQPALPGPNSLMPAPVAEATPAQAAPPAPILDSVANSPSERLVATMKDAPALVWGNPTAPTFYAFMDPGCTHCRRFLREVEPFVLDGRVAVRMVMVGFNETTQKQAAFLLAAADGVERMVRVAKGDETAIEGGASADPQVAVRNMELMHAWNLSGTPIILYRAASDQKIRLVRGRPLDVAATVGDLTGQSVPTAP